MKHISRRVLSLPLPRHTLQAPVARSGGLGFRHGTPSVRPRERPLERAEDLLLLGVHVFLLEILLFLVENCYVGALGPEAVLILLCAVRLRTIDAF